MHVETHLVDQVTACVAKVLDVASADLGVDEDLEAEWGLDSLMKLEIVDEIEAMLGQRFDDRVYEGAVSVRDIAGAIASAGAQPAADA